MFYFPTPFLDYFLTIMRPQGSGMAQQPGPSDLQKKSVFERLGHQLDAGPMMFKRRPSPGSYNDYIPPQMVHGPGPVTGPGSGPVTESEFGPRGPFGHRSDHPNQQELNWRYLNDRGRPANFIPDRHGPSSLGPPMNFHYGGEMQPNRPGNSYFGAPPHHPYGPNGPPHGMSPQHQVPPSGMPPVGSNNYQQRSSPKYDRHGNLLPRFREGPMRLGPMDLHQFPGGPPPMSPPRLFMPQGSVPCHPRDIHPGAHSNIMPGPRWNLNHEIELQQGPMNPRNITPSRRFNQNNSEKPMLGSFSSGPSENPRYIKWRERRDVITNLDRETAQSSFRTDTLKSSLQQPNSIVRSPADTSKTKPSTDSKQSSQRTNEDGIEHRKSQENLQKSKNQVKDVDSKEISDGEIVDDESSSLDECEEESHNIKEKLDIDIKVRHIDTKSDESPVPKKKPKIDRQEYALDYETISDEDLDDFMDERKKNELDSKAHMKKGGSEIELLTALGLDWANLVEMAKETRAPNKRNSSNNSALLRFSVQNYLPTLGVSMELAGPELSAVIRRICRT